MTQAAQAKVLKRRADAVLKRAARKGDARLGKDAPQPPAAAVADGGEQPASKARNTGALPSSGHRGVSRVDNPKRNTHGWYVRVRFGGEGRARFFSDSVHGGRDKALQLAVDERNDLERELGKPRTDRVIIAGSASNRSGTVGVKQTTKGGGPVYEVTWSPRPHVVSRTSVSIRKWGQPEALRRALNIRRAKERELYGGALKSVVAPTESGTMSGDSMA